MAAVEGRPVSEVVREAIRALVADRRADRDFQERPAPRLVTSSDRCASGTARDAAARRGRPGARGGRRQRNVLEEVLADCDVAGLASVAEASRVRPTGSRARRSWCWRSVGAALASGNAATAWLAAAHLLSGDGLRLRIGHLAATTVFEASAELDAREVVAVIEAHTEPHRPRAGPPPAGWTLGTPSGPGVVCARPAVGRSSSDVTTSRPRACGSRPPGSNGSPAAPRSAGVTTGSASPAGERRPSRDPRRRRPPGLRHHRGAGRRHPVGRARRGARPAGAERRRQDHAVRLLATLLVPDSGTVRAGGHDAAADPTAVRSLIGLAGQLAAVDDLLTGRENLDLIRASTASTAPNGRRSGRPGVDRPHRRRRPPGADLLGRHAPAPRPSPPPRGRPAVLPLDEPTTGLDPRSRVEVWHQIEQLAGEGTMVVLTSQQLDEVERLAHRIVLLDRGRVVASGSADALKRHVGGDVLRCGSPTRPTSTSPARRSPRRATARPSSTRGSARSPCRPGREPPRWWRPAAGSGHPPRRAGDPPAVARRRVLRAHRHGRLGDRSGPRRRRRPRRQHRGGRRRRPRGAGARTGSPPSRRPASLGGEGRRRHHRLRPPPPPADTATAVLRPRATMLIVAALLIFGRLVEQQAGVDYAQYLIPGVLVMTTALAAGGTGVALAEDVQAGVVDRFRSLPMARHALLVGRTVADLCRNSAATVLVVGVGLLLGFRFQQGLTRGAAALALVALFGLRSRGCSPPSASPCATSRPPSSSASHRSCPWCSSAAPGSRSRSWPTGCSPSPATNRSTWRSRRCGRSSTAAAPTRAPSSGRSCGRSPPFRPPPPRPARPSRHSPSGGPPGGGVWVPPRPAGASRPGGQTEAIPGGSCARRTSSPHRHGRGRAVTGASVAAPAGGQPGPPGSPTDGPRLLRPPARQLRRPADHRRVARPDPALRRAHPAARRRHRRRHRGELPPRGLRRSAPPARSPPVVPGTTILYDEYGVAHISGRTRADLAFGAGWVTARDRGLLLQLGRGPARPPSPTSRASTRSAW